MDTIRTAYSMQRIGNFFFAMILWIPMIVLPFISYMRSNWWLLLGFPVVFIGGVLALKKRAPFFFGLTIALAGYWMARGFSLHQYLTFFYVCLLFGFLCGILGYGYKDEAAKVYQEVKAREKVADQA